MDEIIIETKLGPVYARSEGRKTDSLVLGLHGWSQRNGWHTWQPLMVPLAEAEFYVVSIDMPGWGQSPPISERPISQSEAVAVILSTLDGLGSKSDAILMGKSWGGGLAIEIALGYPERVRALILTAPAYTDFNRLAALQAPVLLAWAEDDPVIPIRYAANYRTIPTFQLITFTGGGHSAASKNAGAFAPVAIKFLQENCSLPAERGFMESLS